MLPELQNYYFKQELLKNFISQMSKDELSLSGNGDYNSIYWIMGHLTGARFSMLKLSGIAYDLPLAMDFFKKGSSNVHHSEWPDFSLLCDHFEKMGILFYTWLAKNDQKVLQKQMKYVINDEIVTLAENLRFLIFHEDYHVGQIGIILKLLNKKGIGVQN
jgi:hypothetical protein